MKSTTDSSKNISRRRFLKTSQTLAAGSLLVPQFLSGAPAIIRNLGKPNSKIRGVQIGVITYSFRSMESDAESILKYCVDSGISAIELMGNTAESFAGMPSNPIPRGSWRLLRSKDEDLSDNEKKEKAELREKMAANAKAAAEWRASAGTEKFEQFRKMYNDAGVSIYAWKPSALGANNTDAEVEYALRMAKVLGASHVTIELPRDSAQSARLGKLAKKHKVKVAYHGHLQQTPTCWDEALSQSKYNAMNTDIGHYTAAGYDPIPLLKEKHKNITSIHLKDRQNKENGQKNLPWGEGDTPIVQALQLMRNEKYKFPGSIELEYEIPEGSDAVKEVQRCLEYCRKALEG